MASEVNLSRLTRRSPAWGRLATYLQKRGFALYRDTDVHYFKDGGAFFEDLIGQLEKAQTYIFLEYYILAEGAIYLLVTAALLLVLGSAVLAAVGAYMGGQISSFTFSWPVWQAAGMAAALAVT